MINLLIITILIMQEFHNPIMFLCDIFDGLNIRQKLQYSLN